MNDTVNILTPVGRLVSGDCFQGNDKDAEGRPLVVKSGPNAGQPRISFYMGVAIPKTDPEFAALETTLKQVAQKEFPQFFDAQGNCINPQFAFKITDGDSQLPNSKGRKPCDQEGYKGNWILNFSNGFAPKCYSKGGAEELLDSSSIKKGYYIRVYASVKGNGSNQQPGIYLNHSMVELIGYGEEIISGPSGSDIFGGKPATLPNGASATPLAGAPIPQAAVPGAAMQPPAVPGAAMQPPAIPQPAPEVLEPPVKYNVQGNVYTKQQLLDAGWSDQQIEALPKA